MGESIDINKLTDEAMGEAIRRGEIRLEDYIDIDVVEALSALKMEVYNINKTVQNVLTRDKITSGDMIPTAYFEGIDYGVAIHDLGDGIIEEEIMAKPANGVLWTEMSNTDKLGIIGSIVAVFLDKGYTDHRINVIQGCFVFKQKFQVSHIVERNPNLVVPGGTGRAPGGGFKH